MYRTNYATCSGADPGYPLPENFKISCPRKCDFRHSEAKSACFNISFLINGSNFVMSFEEF